mmetsp:Transcript_27995/g.70603  ORF Transcript_27995/g.70603 Transcript_27995/m.70603 type:complete len:222 (-) Transcript_27995:151-816(-)
MCRTLPHFESWSGRACDDKTREYQIFALSLFGCFAADHVLSAPSRCSGGKCLTYCRGGTIAPTLINILGLIFCICDGNEFHSGPVGICICCSYCCGFWKGYGTLSMKYFAASVQLPSWNSTRVDFFATSPLAILAISCCPLPLPFGFLGAIPAPAQWPHPMRRSSWFAASSLCLLLSSCSSSKSLIWLPSTKAVRTRSRCSCAAMESALSGLRTSSAVLIS